MQAAGAKPMATFHKQFVAHLQLAVAQLAPFLLPVLLSLLRWCLHGSYLVLPSSALVLVAQCLGAHTARAAAPAWPTPRFLPAVGSCDAGVAPQELAVQFCWALGAWPPLRCCSPGLSRCCAQGAAGSAPQPVGDSTRSPSVSTSCHQRLSFSLIKSQQGLRKGSGGG